MTNDKHNDTLAALAKAHIKMLIAGDHITLRHVGPDGITIEAPAETPDILLTNTLHNLSSWWGYRHGECETSVEPLHGSFFDAAKSAKITFA